MTAASSDSEVRRRTTRAAGRKRDGSVTSNT